MTMAIREEGSNIVVHGSIAGSLFPSNERDIVFPVLIDGTNANSVLRIGGSVYGRSLEVKGAVWVDGPVVSRGDTKLTPTAGSCIQLMGGVTVNGVFNGGLREGAGGKSIQDGIDHAAIIIRGDLAVNQSLYLNNAIVFGSIRALNCRLVNSVVLGTVQVQEKLSLAMSSIGAYSSGEVSFEGACMLLHALGESTTKPSFVPYQDYSGEIVASDCRYYPAMRDKSRIINSSHRDEVYPEYSKFDEYSDWVNVNKYSNEILDSDANQEVISKWVLSIGGRIGDFGRIQKSIEAMTAMLKCGFEYDHVKLDLRNEMKRLAMEKLNSDETWILDKVCKDSIN
jgi:hypothetical protein